MIQYIDEFLTNDEYKFVVDYCMKSPYYYGEVDDENLPPTGMTHEVEKNISIYNLFEEKTRPYVSDNQTLYRMYVNCFAPGENPYYHTDGKTGITFLFYVNTSYHINDGGETHFFMGKDEAQIILPIPNRLCYFDANILHRATSFKNKHRFTLAIKYK